jgi:hypothetical protein
VSKKKKQKHDDLPPEFLAKLRAITAKRAKTVVDHILAHGHITTEDLSKKYGYDHAPRAARDVREQGIPLETFKVTAANGRKIAAYRFGDPTKVKAGREGGRKVWPKNFKNELIDQFDCKCAICGTNYEARYLQIDHRIPYEVAGDQASNISADDFMLLCGSCNRGKSWSCEHCPNWLEAHDQSICRTCYWASPTEYDHVALRSIRRLDLTWTESEVHHSERLKSLAHGMDQELPDFVKAILQRSVEGQ